MDENLVLFSSSSGSLETSAAFPARSCTSDSDPWREILDSLNSDRYHTSELHDVFSVLPGSQPQPALPSDVSRKDSSFGATERQRTANRLDSSRRCNSEVSASLEGVYGEKKKTRPKRTRSAELHNMSERMRRDKIRVKLKTLQQLIPNCNKTDRASMLDDAIKYLKALKLQVEMMSRGYQAPIVLPERQFCPILPSDMGITSSSSCYPPGIPIIPTNANFPTLQSQLPYLSQATGFNFQESTRQNLAVSYQEIAMMKKELNHVIPDNNSWVSNKFQYGTMVREHQFTEEVGCSQQQFNP